MKRFCLLIGFFLLCSIALGAGGGTVSLDTTKAIARYDIDWAADSTSTCLVAIPGVEGVIYRVSFIPDEGATSPTAGYTATLLDQDDIDLLQGEGTGFSDSAAADLLPRIVSGDGTTTLTMPVAVSGDLELNLAATGATGAGTVRLYVIKP